MDKIIYNVLDQELDKVGYLFVTVFLTFQHLGWPREGGVGVEPVLANWAPDYERISPMQQ